MNNIQKLSLAGLVLLFGCGTNDSSIQQKAKDDITKAEKDFAQMAADKGIAEAFYTFAAEDAVIKRRNDSLIYGKNAIRNFYSAAFYETATVNWTPDFVDASKDGKIGYTYGKYVWQSKDSTGKTETVNGIFHTVWKKQPDGSWKYVWD